mgnify:CR=1 FL=1
MVALPILSVPERLSERPTLTVSVALMPVWMLTPAAEPSSSATPLKLVVVAMVSIAGSAPSRFFMMMSTMRIRPEYSGSER